MILIAMLRLCILCHWEAVPAVKLENLKKKLRRHALRVKEPGWYLEAMDILLYCSRLETEAVVFCNTISDFEQGRPASDFLEGLLGPQASKLLTPKHASTWSILMTRSDFRPSNDPSEWNHWLVCHPSGSLQLADRLKIIDKELLEYKNWVFEQTNQVDPSDEALLESLFGLTASRSEKIHHFKNLTRRVHQHAKLYPVDGTPDGNCGVYMIMSLLSKEGAANALQSTSISAGDTDPQEMMAVREDLAKLWNSVAESEEIAVWGKIFEHLASPIANTPDPQFGYHNLPDEAAPGNHDGPTTPRKQKDLGAPDFPDITPPRVSDTARKRPGAGIAVARPATGPSVPLSKLYNEHVPTTKNPPNVRLEKPDVVKIMKVELSPDKTKVQIKAEPGVAERQIKAEPGVAERQIKAEPGVAELQVKAEPEEPEDPGPPEYPECPGDPEVPEVPAEIGEWDWGESDGDDAPEVPGSDSEDEMLDTVLGRRMLPSKENQMKFCGPRFFVLNE